MKGLHRVLTLLVGAVLAPATSAHYNMLLPDKASAANNKNPRAGKSRKRAGLHQARAAAGLR